MNRYNDFVDPLFGGIVLLMMAIAFFTRDHLPDRTRLFLAANSWWLSAVGFIWWGATYTGNLFHLLIYGALGAFAGLLTGSFFSDEGPLGNVRREGVQPDRTDWAPPQETSDRIEDARLTTPTDVLRNAPSCEETRAPPNNLWVRCVKCHQLTSVPRGATSACGYCGTSAPLLASSNRPVSIQPAKVEMGFSTASGGAQTHKPQPVVSDANTSLEEMDELLQAMLANQSESVTESTDSTSAGVSRKTDQLKAGSIIGNPMVSADKSQTAVAIDRKDFSARGSGRSWERTPTGLQNIASGAVIPERHFIRMLGAKPGFRIICIDYGMSWVPDEDVNSGNRQDK